MPQGRPRLHKNQADKQFMYRQRKKAQQEEERDLALRLQDVLTAAQMRGAIHDTRAPLRSQLDELCEWLRH